MVHNEHGSSCSIQYTFMSLNVKATFLLKLKETYATKKT